MDTTAKAFLHLLSRADTLHDFVGARSVLSKTEVLKLLNDSKSELTEKSLLPELKKGRFDERNIKGILNKNESSPLVNLNFPSTYTPKIIKRIGGITGYEPKTVLFYETHEDLLKTANEDVNIGRYVSNDAIVGYSYVTNQYDNGDSSIFSSANIAYLNLGTTQKKDKSGSIIRNFSGIYTYTSTSDQYKLFEEKIDEFFGTKGATNVYLIVDTCGVSLSDIGVQQSTKIKLLCNVAGEWDGATKTACIPKNTLCMGIEDQPSDPLKRSVFGLKTLKLEKNPSKPGQAIINGNQVNADKAVVEVTPLSKCINETLGGKAKKVKSTCYSGLSGFEMFDIKRTGDAFQALITKNAKDGMFCQGAPPNTSDKFIFVTLDHLAFLKARLNGIPSIFTSKDGLTEEKLMFMYKPEVDYKSMAVQFINSHAKLKSILDAMIKVQLNDIIDDIAYYHATGYTITDDIPIIQLKKNAPTNSLYQDKEKTIGYIQNFYSGLLQNDPTKLDQMFYNNDPWITLKAKVNFEKAADRKSSAIESLVTQATTLYDKFPDSEKKNNHYKNLGKLINWLPKTIFKTINMILYVEITARICEMYKHFEFKGGKWEMNELGNVEKLWTEILNEYGPLNDVTLIATLFDKSPMTLLPDKSAEMNDKLSKLSEYITKYEYLANPTEGQLVQKVFGIEIDDYANIILRLIDIINGGLYGKKTGEASLSLVEMIAKTDGSDRQKISIALEASNRFVLNIMNKILDTLISFARVKISSIDVAGAPTAPEALIAMIGQLENQLSTMKGGSLSDETKLEGGATLEELIGVVDRIIEFQRHEFDEDLQESFHDPVLVNDDPYDYGNLIDKFKEYIIHEIPDETIGSLTKYEDIEYYVHYYLEKVMRDNSYLYPGLAAFWADAEYTAPQYNQWGWDDFVCFTMIYDPYWLYGVNTALLTGDKTKLNQFMEWATAAIRETRNPGPLLRSISTPGALDLSMMSLEPYSKGGGSINRCTMADYFYKYYRPYYELYYKNK